MGCQKDEPECTVSGDARKTAGCPQLEDGPDLEHDEVMAARLLHAVHESTSEDALAHLSLLLNRLPPERFSQAVFMFGRPAPVLRLPSAVPIERVHGCSLMPMLPGTRAVRLLRRKSFDLLLMWDWSPCLDFGRKGSDQPSLTILSSPLGRPGILFGYLMRRKCAQQTNVVCLSDSVRKQLVRLGLKSDSVRVIRPSVDPAEIRHADRQRVRSEIGLPADARVLLTACPPGTKGGQYAAVWAAAILHQIWPDVRMILPGGFRGDGRARRLSEECYCPQIFRIAAEQYGPADLLAASDMFIWPDGRSHSTGWLAWAMAAGIPIVATDGPSVRELIRDGQTGFLVGSSQPHALATRIRTAWDDAEARRRCAQEAVRQAGQMCCAQKCLDAYVSLMEQLLLPCER